MASALKQFHRGTEPVRFLYPLPHATGRHTVSGAEIYEPEWFVKEAAGVRHEGETLREACERSAKLRRVIKDAAIILAAVGLIVAGWVLG